VAAIACGCYCVIEAGYFGTGIRFAALAVEWGCIA